MKNTQKKRRSCAAIMGLLLCILTILPLTVAAEDTSSAPTGALFYFKSDGTWVSPNAGSGYYQFCNVSKVAFYHRNSGRTVTVHGSNVMLSWLVLFEETAADWSVTPYWGIYDEYLIGDTYNALEWDVYVYPYGDVLPYNSDYEVGMPYADFEMEMDDYGDWGSIDTNFSQLANRYSGPNEYYRTYLGIWNAGAANGNVSDRYDEGFQDGRDVGFTEGKNEGIQIGETQALNAKGTFVELVFAIFSAPVDLINGILDFDLFGINVAGLVKTLLTLGVTALIMWFILKLVRG